MKTTGDLNAYWFLDTLVKVKVSGETNSDGISVLEHHARYGDSPPLHIHQREDEVFIILNGEFRFVIETREHLIKEGETILAPKGIPHTYRVESSGGGKWLTITTRGDFENFVKAFSRPAEKNDLPELKELSDEFKQQLSSLSAKYYLEIVGPPLH